MTWVNRDYIPVSNDKAPENVKAVISPKLNPAVAIHFSIAYFIKKSSIFETMYS